jgi:predicted lipopolysaccharide heptosyltransferase III
LKLIAQRVLLVKLRYIGDTLSLLPVIENLKREAPRVPIDVMVNRGTEEVLAHHPAVHKVWTYDSGQAKGSALSSIRYHRHLIKGLRAQKYDIVIDFTHGDRAAFLSFMTGAPHRMTYQRASRLSRLLMNRQIPAEPSQHHIVDYQLEALRLFGLHHFNRQASLHIPKELHERMERLLADIAHPQDGPLVVIHPGARGKLRRWPPERFAHIARHLKNAYRASIIILGGPKEGLLVREVEERAGFKAFFTSTTLTLLDMAALLSRCHLLVANDSAPAHIAAAVDCPTVTLFGPTFPRLWRPLSPAGEVVFSNPPCCGCPQEVCIRPDHFCMDLIEVNQVREKIDTLLNHAQNEWAHSRGS